MQDNKMFRAIINGQSALKGELLDKIGGVDKKVDEGFKKVDERFKEVNNRIDKLGLQLAELSDDAPTNKEFDSLEKRVSKVEKQTASN